MPRARSAIAVIDSRMGDSAGTPATGTEPRGALMFTEPAKGTTTESVPPESSCQKALICKSIAHPVIVTPAGTLTVWFLKEVTPLQTWDTWARGSTAIDRIGESG